MLSGLAKGAKVYLPETENSQKNNNTHKNISLELYGMINAVQFSKI